MALINDNHKFIFQHLYKCGGLTLRKVLETETKGCYEILSGHNLPLDLRIHFNHIGAIGKWEQYFKFTIVRNPFDFMVSVFLYAKNFSNHFMHNRIVDGSMTMKEFIPYYFEVMEFHKCYDLGVDKVTTPYTYTHDENGNNIFDFVAKLENIKEDLKYIYSMIGMEYKELPLYNVTMNKEPDYRIYYDHDSRRIIEERFAKDLITFGYTF